MSEGNREVTINSAAKREEVEFNFDETGQRVTTGHTVIAVTAYTANQLPDGGPPKPPRRQQSLNRIHIPDGPDYDPESSESPGSNSPQNSRHQREPTYENYHESGYSGSQSEAGYYSKETKTQFTRQRSAPGNSLYREDPPDYRDVEEYRAKMSNYTTEYNMEQKRRKGVKVRKTTSDRMYRSDGELGYSEPELEWNDRRSNNYHSDTLRTDPGRSQSTLDQPYKSPLRHSDSLRSAPGGYSYGGSSWKDEPSWKMDPRQRYQREQYAYHGSMERQSRHEHVSRSQRQTSNTVPEKYGGHYPSQQAPANNNYAGKPANPTDYNNTQGINNGNSRYGKRNTTTSLNKQGYSSDSGVSSFRQQSENENSDPLYENTDRRHHPSNGYDSKNKNNILPRDGGGYIIKGSNEMAVDVPVQMQKASAPLMANPPQPREGSIPNQYPSHQDEIQAAPPSSVTQEPKWGEHLAKRDQRRELLRSSSSPDSLGSNESHENQHKSRKAPVPQRRNTTEGVIQPQQAATQESGFPDDMSKRQRQNGRVSSHGAPNSAHHGPYNDPNVPYAPKRPFDPYMPYYAPYPGYPGYVPISPVDPRFGAQSPSHMPYGPGYPVDGQQVPGNQSPYGQQGPPPQGWPAPGYGPPPQSQPQGFVPYDKARETYSAAYNMPPYMPHHQGGYFQPPIPSTMFYGSGYPGEPVQASRAQPQETAPLQQRSRSVDAEVLKASAQPALESAPPPRAASPKRSMSPDEKAKRMQELRQRIRSYIPPEEKKRSQSVGSAEPTKEEVIMPSKTNVSHVAPNQSDSAASIGAKLFLQKKKQSVLQDMKQTMLRDIAYGNGERAYRSEPEMTTSDSEVPFKSSSARPLRVGEDATDSKHRLKEEDKAAEMALNELEQMYSMLDQEASELLQSGEYEQRVRRLNELKESARQKLEDLRIENEMEELSGPPSQRGKRRPRKDRAKSDITQDHHAMTPSEDERQQQFFPYRTSAHPDNLDLDNQSYKPPKDSKKQNLFITKRSSGGSSSEEDNDDGDDDDERMRRQPQSSIYRTPKSEDYLGYSSDSSPSPERKMRNSKRRPVAQPRHGDGQALPEYIKKSSARMDHAGAPRSGYDSDKSTKSEGRSSLADRRREFFLSGPLQPEIAVDLERECTNRTELQLEVARYTTTLQTSSELTRNITSRSVSPLPRNQTQSEPSRTRSTSPSTNTKKVKDKKPKARKVNEPAITSVSQKPVEEAPSRKPVPAPRKTVPLLQVPSVENQPPGTRLSTSSVSTIDSTGLVQPFEEMSREYGTLIGEHYPHMAGRDLSRHSSSMESLVQAVTMEPKKVPRQTVELRAPTPPSHPPPESDIEKSGDEKKRKGAGGIWALLGPKADSKKPEEYRLAPAPSPEPDLTDDESSDESFQTPGSSTPSSSEESMEEVEETLLQPTTVTLPELSPNIFDMPLADLHTMHHMDSDSDEESESIPPVEDSADGSEPVKSYQGGVDNIKFADNSSDEDEDQSDLETTMLEKTVVMTRTSNKSYHMVKQTRGPNNNNMTIEAYDKNGK